MMPAVSADLPKKSSRPGSRWRYLLAVYLVVLVLSHVARFGGAGKGSEAAPDDPGGLQPGVQSSVHVIEVAAVGGQPEETVRFAYREWGADADLARQVVLLLHGSPGDGSNFDLLGPLLAERYRVLAPDLPGFGASDHQVPDYSILAHSHYTLELLRRLGIERAHVVGFSMGGGVALHLAESKPEMASSLVMLAAIGIQELELLGQYHLNHALHGLQLAGLWLLAEATPHFGAFDGLVLGLPYARNFYDTDQRPLRGVLESFAGPMLILHGDGDVLVPYAAAVEHHRLVPQSELVTFAANHFMVFGNPQKLATPMLDFFTRVDAGSAVRRDQADADRVRAAEDPMGFRPPRINGLALVIALVLIALATLVSEDLACIAGGLLVAQGRLGFIEATGACFAGIFFGDLMLYGLGRLGRPWLARAPLKWFISPTAVVRSTRWFEQRGPWVILLSRFLPGTRLPTYVAAGLLRTNVWKFALNLLIPVALWTPLLVSLARTVGERFFETFETFHRYALPSFVGLLISVWILIGLVRSLASYRGRRLLVGWWKRKRHWEFWPRWVFYPPVVAYVLWLGLRHRSLTVFTAANPGIPAAGGFHGESKAEILASFGQNWVARFRLIPGSSTQNEKRAAVREFMSDSELEYPIVLKPDQGLRGVGVAVVENDDDADQYLRVASGDVIVQEYVGGPELGVFYLRQPGEPVGRIFSITEKVRPSVLGDGWSTLERLILVDERAVSLAHVYSRILAAELDRVPAIEEKVRLVEIGSHSGGVVCLDGEQYGTTALTSAIESVARSCEGFYFGRFDLRAPSHDCFLEGRGFKVLELNGVTSEATHIYDRKYSVWHAWRVLFEQWRLVFEIGARNRDRGVSPATFGELVRMLLPSLRR